MCRRPCRCVSVGVRACPRARAILRSGATYIPFASGPWNAYQRIAQCMLCGTFRTPARFCAQSSAAPPLSRAPASPGNQQGQRARRSFSSSSLWWRRLRPHLDRAMPAAFPRNDAHALVHWESCLQGSESLRPSLLVPTRTSVPEQPLRPARATVMLTRSAPTHPSFVF